MASDVVVSIMCITYNHEKYIREALLGFINQNTNFKIEAIVADDHSTDNTQVIIREFKSLFPNIIKPIYRERNIGARANWIDALKKCNGKYIAICEGDDYWLDPDKLQKQVDFLESHPDFAMCSHAVKTVYEKVEEKDPFVKPLKISTFEDIVSHGHFIPTLSIVFRRNALPEIPSWFKEVLSGDIPLILLVTHHGKNYYMDEIMGLKRKHPGGVTQSQERSKKNFVELRRKKELFLYKKLNEYFNYEHKKVLNPAVAKCLFKIMLINLENKNWNEFVNNLIKSFYISPSTFLRRLGGELLIKL